MAQEIVLAPTANAANSTDITITGGEATVFAYATAGAAFTCGFQVSIRRKIGSDYEASSQVILDRDNPAISLAAGVYRAVKGATPQAIGVAVDS